MPSVRTAGGHRRLPISGVLQFLRQRKYRLVRPEILGLPATTTSAAINLEQARQRVKAALEVGDEVVLRRTIFDITHVMGRQHMHQAVGQGGDARLKLLDVPADAKPRLAVAQEP